MIVHQKAASVGRLTWSFSLAPLAALIGGALLAGGIIGATLTWQLDRSIASESNSLTGPQATFDAVGFRAEERERVAKPHATFDAVRFRARNERRWPPETFSTRDAAGFITRRLAG